MTKKIEVVAAFRPLLQQKARYKVFYGGRGGAKSYNFALSALLLARQNKLRILNVREIQRSIKDSVHKLYEDLIHKYELSDYDVKRDSIVNLATGSEFIFAGLHRNVQEIKSMEGIDIAWVEEAQSVSDESFEILLPTIRKENSEIWLSFNRYSDNDPVYKRFVAKPRENSIIQQVLWSDNPFFPSVLREEMAADFELDPDRAAHIWNGEPLAQLDKAVINRNIVHNAMKRTLEQSEGATQIGCDVARFGADRTVYYTRHGKKIVNHGAYEKQSVTYTANMLMDAANYDKQIPIKVDDGGVGGGVTDILRDKGFNVQPVNFGGKAKDSDRYPNAAAEMWFELAQALRDADIPDDGELASELTNRTYHYDTRGRRALERKEEYKKRQGASPDKADALALCFYEPLAAAVIDEVYFVSGGLR